VDNGTFYLLLDSPPTGGTYNCILPPLAPATACLPSQSPLREGASVEVNEARATFSLLQAQQNENMAKVMAENDKLKDQIGILTTETKDLQARNEALEANRQ
jgi:hypothetical protein